MPETIDPIEFSAGLNLIYGETDETSNKNNGVGKSLCIEFINFALLKDKSHSRVVLIPECDFARDTYICLDFVINTNQFTIKRSLRDSDTPIIFKNGISTEFTKIEDARNYLSEHIFSKSSSTYPTFRTMLGLLIRDERSEFKSIVSCYDTKHRIPDDYSPHLYLLGIDINIYLQIKEYIKEIGIIDNQIRQIKDSVELLRHKDIKEARSDLNELDSEVTSIETSIEKLENISGYEIFKNEIIQIENNLEVLRNKKSILNKQLLKLKPISRKVDIDTTEIFELYENLKNGLGKLIVKDFNEVIKFKEKIDEFQNYILNEKRQSLTEEIKVLEENIDGLDKKYKENLLILDQQGHLKNLKQTYASFKKKSDELYQLRFYIDSYDELVSKKQKIKSQKEVDLLKLQSEIFASKKIIESFEKLILFIHEFIQGNRKASFKIDQTSNKQVIEIIMRIDDDGSHSVDRLKVFIYDIALLLCDEINLRHPGFLVHDNIFDVDQDTLIKSLNFLAKKVSSEKEKQYILTLNADRIPNDLLENLKPYEKASFTKSKRFLKTKYQELNKKRI